MLGCRSEPGGAEVEMPETRPFRIAVPEEQLAAIRRRVGEFAWDDMPLLIEDGDAWSAGASLAFMRELCDYWVGDFDWRAQEAAINRFPQVMARIGEQEIHVLHEPGSGSHDMALVLTHGWPGSILEFLDVIERLAHPERFGGNAADGIDVVVPALPGFGFSGRPAMPIGPRKIACLWDHLLCKILGYRRYIAQGGDWGSMVSAMAGLDHSPAQDGGCAAIHLNLFVSSVPYEPATDEERAFIARSEPFIRDGRAYAETHRTRPQTLAFAMAGNPVGAAAWIIDKFHAWSDLRERNLRELFGMDRLLGNVMFYVTTGSFATASWIYRAAQYEVMRVLPAGTRIDVPTGFASFPCELRPRPPRSLIERTYRLEHFSEFARGGHFAAMEVPDLFVADVAAFVRQVRAPTLPSPASGGRSGRGLARG
jgi:pimeloyl-ACP methyl ester carboxylesterase